MSARAPRNWPAIGGFVLGVGGVVGYFALVMRHDSGLNWLLRTPVVNLALVAVGLFLSLVGVISAFQHTRGGRVLAPILGALNLALCGFWVWQLFVASYHLPSAAHAPAVGTAAPDFELRNDHGDPVRLSSWRGRNVVLLFYRGFW